jgi:GNAT superfamily N-acetyltransferase
MPDFLNLPGSTATLRTLEADDGAALQALCEACSDFTEEVTGLPPGPAEAQSIFIGLPPEGDYDRKRLWGVYQDGQMIGVIDAYLGHPASDEFWTGLLMLHPAVRRQGLGEKLLLFLQNYARSQGARTLGLAVKQNFPAAQAFWTSQGFRKQRAAELHMAGHGPTMFDILQLDLTA